MTESLNLLQQTAVLIAGLIILHYALTAINRMSARTQHGVRVAFILLAAGAFGQVLGPILTPAVGSGADLMLSGGLALLLVFDRRCVTCPVSARQGERRRRDDRMDKARAI